MSNDWDANIKLLYPTDSGTFFTIDDVAQGATFDVVANVEIGENLNEFIDRFDLRIGIVNLTRAASVVTVADGDVLQPDKGPRLEERRVTVPSGWQNQADPGDVLQAVASYKVTAGVNIDYSTAESVTFVVSP